jgi:chemotaxis protein CheX
MNITVGSATQDSSCLVGNSVITGMIGLAGTYRGTVAIHFSKGLALRSVSAMLGMETTELTDDIKDAIGEIANIVAGGVKTELSTQGISFDLSLPSVISGEHYTIHLKDSQNVQKSTILPFTFEGNTMCVEYDIQKSEG